MVDGERLAGELSGGRVGVVGVPTKVVRGDNASIVDVEVAVTADDCRQRIDLDRPIAEGAAAAAAENSTPRA
jgi:hypothetical protein